LETGIYGYNPEDLTGDMEQTQSMTRIRVLRALEVLAWTIFFVLAISVLVLRYWALPNIERFRGDIVAAVSSGVGMRVTVGAIDADWRGLRPQIELSDVRVHDGDGREALVLPRVTSVLSWRSFLFMDLRVRSFTIEGPRLAVRRDARGAIHVAGVELSHRKGDGRVADWILGQKEIIIRDAEIEWTDELRGAPPLLLASLQFRLANDGDQHDIGVSARPPPHLGSGLELRARLVGDSIAQPATWNGRVFAELGYTDLAGWRRWVDYPADVRSGQGALRLWATLGNGRLTRAIADVALTGVVAQLGRDLPVLDVTSVRGRLQGRETPHGYEFGARDLALATASGPEMLDTSFVALVEGDVPHRADGQFVDDWKPSRGTVTANRIELAPLAYLAEFLPFPADLRKVLAEFAPRGSVNDAKFEWTGELPDAAKFKLRARFSELAMNSWRRLPGFSGLSGSIEATEAKGTLQLASQRAELDLPRVFPEPRIALDALSGQLDWDRPDAARVNVRLGNLALSNAHMAGSAFGSYAYAGDGPGTIDLTAQFSRLDGKHTSKYLPLASLMGERARGWVAGAIQSGLSGEASVRLKGNLRDFPFAGGKTGQFRIAAKISRGVLDYTEGWPRIEGIEGDLLFENEKMEIVGRSGRILGARVTNVRVALPSLLAEDRVLRVEGTAEGPMKGFFDYIAQSPVTRYIDGATDGMSMSGNGRLALKLQIPLDTKDAARVQGEIRISSGTLVASPRLPPIERASGTISFTESTFDIREASGQVFGGPVTLSGGTRKEGGLAIVARGSFTPEGMRPVFDHPWRRYASGSAPYSATLSSRAGSAQVAFESTLAGIAVALPPPLGKTSQESMPLRIELVPGGSGAQERISVTLARSLHAEFLRAREAGEMKLQRAAVSLNPPAGEALRLPERRGLLVYGTLPGLDVDHWRALMSAEAGAGAGIATSFDLKLGSLDAFGKRLRTVSMKGGIDAGGWSANVNSAELSGDIAYRAEGNGRLTARMAYFTIPDDAPGPKSASVAASAKEFPAVDLVAESFTFRGRKLGRVEIAAEHEGQNWRIGKIAIINPDSAMSGKGLWRPAAQAGEAARTTLSFTVDSSDVGRFLDRMGNPDHIKGATAQIAGNLSWNGDPVGFDYPTLSGDLTLRMKDGQFLEIEPGIGKLVSLMSLQMLPRRIALDFRDVFSKGFQFDNISAGFTVSRGIMNTRDFRMKGPAAEVSIAGDVDLARETQRLQVKVIPELGSTASTVVGLLNPIAGVATMIAQSLLKNPLGQAFAFNYQVTGAWADPKVVKLASGPTESQAAPPEPQATPREPQATPREPAKAN